MVLSIIIAVLSSSVINSILTFIFTMIQKKNDKNDNTVKAERLTLLYIIKSSGKEYLAEGYISETDFKAMEETYNLYKDLGGDGYADKIWHAINALDVK